MTERSDLDGTMSDWFDEQVGRGAPDYLDKVLDRTIQIRQRPAWSSLERWLPVQTSLRLPRVARSAWLLAIAALIVALAAAALGIGSRQRSLPPPFGPARNGAIVFGGTDLDIHAFDSVSGATTVLVSGDATDHGPLMSPDGLRFSFLRDTTTTDPVRGGREPMLMVANVDGSAIRAVTGALVNYEPAAWSHSSTWSHDGSRIAVASDVDGKPSLRVFPVDGAGVPTVIDLEGATASYVSFRPGDQELTYLGWTGNSNALYSVHADGRGLRPILLRANGDYASLSPDGTKIAYQTIAETGATFGLVRVVDVDTGVVTAPAVDPATSGADDNPSWSPDGTRLMFQRYAAGAYRMAVVAATGGRVIEIGPGRPQNNGERVGAQFSPDGLQVMAHYDGDGSTWLLDPTGTTPGTLLPRTIAETATWQRLALTP